MKLYSFTMLLALIVLVAACQKVSDQAQPKSDDPIIFAQIAACSDCNTTLIPSCCCEITLGQGTPAATLELCGTTSPTSDASVCQGITPPTGCEPIGPAREISINLSAFTPVYRFCAGQGYTFQVSNTSGSSANLVITCRNSGGMVIDILNTTVPASSAVYATVDSDCEIDECP